MKLIKNGQVVADFLPNENPGTSATTMYLVENSYSRSAPARNRSPLRAEPFESVTHSFGVHIMSSTEQGCLDLYSTLVNLFDEAEQFVDEQTGSALVFRLQATQTATITDTMILGRASDQPMVGVSVSVYSDTEEGWVLDIPITFQTKSLLVNPILPLEVLTANQEVRHVHTTNLATSERVLSPTRVRFSLSQSAGTAGTAPDGVLLVGTQIMRYSGYTLAPASGNAYWTRASQAANLLADSNLVAQFTPGGSTVFQAATDIFLTLNQPRYLCWIVAKTSIPMYVRLHVFRQSNELLVRSNPVLVSATSPKVIPLGLVSLSQTASVLNITAQSPNGTGTLQINALYLMAYNDESNIISYGPHPKPSNSGSETEDIVCESRYLSQTLAGLSDTFVDDLIYSPDPYSYWVPTDGNPLVMTKSSTLQIALLGTMPLTDTPSQIAWVPYGGGTYATRYLKIGVRRMSADHFSH